MKIAVLSDIHGNLPALGAITDHIEIWGADAVFVAGDIVNRGPSSRDCLDFIQKRQQEKNWQVIRGNHEDYVIQRADPNDPKNGPYYELFQPVHFTYQQLNHDISGLQSLPVQISWSGKDVGEIRVVHASMRSDRDGIYPETQDEELKEQIAPPPAVFITGHTHRPLARTLNGCLIVNAGSVGLPFDGDTRAGYAQIIWNKGCWKSKIIRLKYDIAQTEKDFRESGYLEGGGPLASIVLLELKFALSQLYPWTQKYAKSILQRTITVEKAVKDYLDDPIFRPYWQGLQ